MMRFCQLLFTGMFVFSTFAGSLQAQEDTKPWSEAEPLQWSDFHKKPPHTSDAAAMSSIGIEVDFVSEGKLLTIKLTTYFDRNDSWGRKDDQTAYILNHEQMHFNITEIFARKFRQEAAEKMPKAAAGEIEDLLRKLHHKYSMESNAYQQQYDRETDHSRNSDRQKDWDESILEQLELLENYTSTDITIRLE